MDFDIYDLDKKEECIEILERMVNDYYIKNWPEDEIEALQFAIHYLKNIS